MQDLIYFIGSCDREEVKEGEEEEEEEEEA